MSKKDFELIADVIRRMDWMPAVDKHELAVQFALELRHTNPLFDHDRFMRAATGEDS